MSGRNAVILFNLGGPDTLDAVKPFLFNLFNDSAIIRQPLPLRWALAKVIATRRASTARAIYERMGGKSPLLEQTEAQARALEDAMRSDGVKTFVCMRYWHPMTEAVVEEVVRYAPEKIALLPLYPQFSSSTTASSLQKWDYLARKRLVMPAVRICCYPEDAGFVDAIAARIRTVLAGWSGRPPRLLYSAHGVPKAFIAAGDPYQAQIERTVAGIRNALGREDLDHVVCYQSRVGPLDWIGPYTDDEIERAGAESKPLIVVPVAFVSEHSETLVELDRDYRDLAERSGVPAYERVGTVGTDRTFIDGLARLARRALASTAPVISGAGGRICAASDRDCPFVADHPG